MLSGWYNELVHRVYKSTNKYFGSPTLWYNLRFCEPGNYGKDGCHNQEIVIYMVIDTNGMVWS